MAAHIDGHRQPGHMGGGSLNGQPQAGGLSAEALGTDAQSVDGLQQLLLQLGVVGVGIGLVDGTQQGVLGQIGAKSLMNFFISIALRYFG